MLSFAWLTLRQAKEALQNGRLEEAHRLLHQEGAAGYRGSGELLQQVSRGFLERARRKFEEGDTVAAWNDLLHAEQIGSPGDLGARLRQDLTKTGMEHAKAYLQAGEPGRAADAAGHLREHGVRLPEVQMLEDGAKHWTRATELAARGEFGAARQAVERAAHLLPDRPGALTRFESQLRDHAANFSQLIVQLHDALGRRDTKQVLLLADQILGIAPQHEEARRARARAWKAVEPATITSPSPDTTASRSAPRPRAPRFVLWVDGIGGYLVCLGEEITLGQATPEACVDVPLLADVSRIHAKLSRDSEGYLLEAVRPLQVNGKPTEKGLLKSGDRVQLGKACQLRFTQPVAVSATGQLELISGHRFPIAVEKAFLMADTLVLGPTGQAHVIVPDLKHPVVLYRHKDGLGVRYAGPLTVDGQACRERAVLGPNSQVTGEDFSFALESLEQG